MYQLTSSPSVICKDNLLFIPTDPLNQDYVEYLDWLAKGNTPTPYVPPAVID